jgi:hypothetical protein
MHRNKFIVMIYFKRFLRYCCSVIAFLSAGQQPVSAQAVLVYFKPLPATDTIHVEVNLEPDSLALGDTIPNSLFFSEIPAAYLQEIDYLADSSAALVLGRGHFSLNDSIAAYWVEIRQYWFQHHALFIYDRHRKTFVDMVRLAEWYGGESGQILVGSWLFDYDGDGQKDIFRREIRHSMVPEGETVLERTEEMAGLLRWENGKFRETIIDPFSEHAVAGKRFPIRSFW